MARRAEACVEGVEKFIQARVLNVAHLAHLDIKLCTRKRQRRGVQRRAITVDAKAGVDQCVAHSNRRAWHDLDPTPLLRRRVEGEHFPQLRHTLDASCSIHERVHWQVRDLGGHELAIPQDLCAHRVARPGVPRHEIVCGNGIEPPRKLGCRDQHRHQSTVIRKSVTCVSSAPRSA